MNTQRPMAVSMVAGRVRRTGVGLFARRSSDMADPPKLLPQKPRLYGPQYWAKPLRTIGHRLVCFKKNVSVTMG
jgi:hypothetical protein